MTRHFHEGRACDAALRFMERQRGATRENLRFPERQGHEFPVELVCDLNGALVALEHTGTEPFEGHVRLIAEAQRRVQPLVDAVVPQLPPTEDFYLELPLESLGALRGKELDAVHHALAKRLIEIAPLLPIAELGRRTPGRSMTVPGVPFPWRLQRTARYRGIKIPFHLIFQAGDVEQRRLDRMRRTLGVKCSKLAGWKASAGAHTVLVLEWSDFSLTNQHLIADALLSAEAEIDNRADEVYLVAPLDRLWSVYTLRTGSRTWLDLEPEERAWEVPEAILEDITRGSH